MGFKLIGQPLSILLLCLFVGACNDAHLQTSSSQNQPIKVGIHAGGVSTRTQMLDNGLSAVWTEGDRLSLWAVGSSGEAVLSNQVFTAYGTDAGRGFFTSELASPMPEDTYTYYCTYPTPSSIDGNTAVFNISAIQDGKVTSGSDVLVATPVTHGALAPLPEIEDHSAMQLKMNHMMHQFRFFVPQDDEHLQGAEITRMVLTFPEPVVGQVQLNISDPEQNAVLSAGYREVTLNLAAPLAKDKQNFACVAFVPTKFSDGDMLHVKAYAGDKIVQVDPIDLKSRYFEAGHSTAVRLDVKKLADFAGVLTFTVSANNLGENPEVVTFKAPEGCRFGDGGSNVFVYDPGREIAVGETITIEFESDIDAYKAFSGKNISVTYDSEHAVLTETVSIPEISQSGKTHVSLTVPYLLYQDFSGILKEGESYGNNSYASDERKQPGVSLDGIMPENGWNASRFWMKPDGGAIRINMRYQMVKIFLSFTTSHYGRLDTPPLSALKTGAIANLRVTFDAGANVNSGSNNDAQTGNLTFINMTTHENSSNPINGVGIGTGQSGKIEDFGVQYYKSSGMPNAYGADDFLNTYPTHTVTGVEATNATRLCFYPSTAFIKEGICNAEFNVYIDNIKVQIDN